MELNEKTIIDALCFKSLKESPGNKVFPNTYLGRHEADIFLVTKAGYLYEYEVKTSRSDFFADFKKKGKHERLIKGERANYFAYIVPEGLVNPDEVPTYAGLYEITGTYEVSVSKLGDYDGNSSWKEPRLMVKNTKAKTLLSKEKLGNTNLLKLYESTYYRFHGKNRDGYKTISLLAMEEYGRAVYNQAIDDVLELREYHRHEACGDLFEDVNTLNLKKMNKRIFKYPLAIADEQIVQLPLGYIILDLQAQYDKPTMWALVDDKEKHLVDVRVLMFGTGHEVSESNFLNYQGTFQIMDGGLVYHVFTDDSPF